MEHRCGDAAAASHCVSALFHEALIPPLSSTHIKRDVSETGRFSVSWRLRCVLSRPEFSLIEATIGVLDVRSCLVNGAAVFVCRSAFLKMPKQPREMTSLDGCCP